MIAKEEGSRRLQGQEEEEEEEEEEDDDKIVICMRAAHAPAHKPPARNLKTENLSTCQIGNRTRRAAQVCFYTTDNR